jgi:hypothetical protein
MSQSKPAADFRVNALDLLPVPVFRQNDYFLFPELVED